MTSVTEITDSVRNDVPGGKRSHCANGLVDALAYLGEDVGVEQGLIHQVPPPRPLLPDFMACSTAWSSNSASRVVPEIPAPREGIDWDGKAARPGKRVVIEAKRPAAELLKLGGAQGNSGDGDQWRGDERLCKAA